MSDQTQDPASLPENDLAATQQAEPSKPSGTPEPTKKMAGALAATATDPNRPITLLPHEFQAFKAMEKRLEQMEHERQIELDTKENERLKLLAAKEGAEKALDQQRSKWEAKHADAVNAYRELERQVLSRELDAAINKAFEGRSFLGETPEQKAHMATAVRGLVSSDLEAVRLDNGVIVVRSKTDSRAAADHLKERLDSSEFAAFFAATKPKGGSGADGSRPASPPKDVPPGSLEAIVADYRNRQGQYASFGLRRQSSSNTN